MRSLIALAAALCAAGPFAPMTARAEAPAPTVVRFATFNASLNRNFDGQLLDDLAACRATPRLRTACSRSATSPR
jgi:hypothetical protein